MTPGEKKTMSGKNMENGAKKRNFSTFFFTFVHICFTCFSHFFFSHCWFFLTLFSHFFHKNVKTMWNTCEKMCFKNTVLLLEKVRKKQTFWNCIWKKKHMKRKEHVKKYVNTCHMWKKKHLNIQWGRCNSEIFSSGLIL